MGKKLYTSKFNRKKIDIRLQKRHPYLKKKLTDGFCFGNKSEFIETLQAHLLFKRRTHLVKYFR